MEKTGKIKILHIANTDFFFYYLLRDHLLALKDEGMDIHVLCPPGRYREPLERLGFSVTYMPISREINILGDIFSIIRLTRYIRQQRFDIVHTHTGKGGFVGRVSAWLARTRIIFHTIHGFSFYPGQNWLHYRLAKFSERVCGYISRRVFFQNREDFEEVKKSRLIGTSKIRYIGNGINIESVLNELDRGRKRDYRKELGLGSKTRVIGFFARLERIKRHEFFLRAFSSVVKKLPDTVCLIAGEGPLEGNLHRITKELSLEKNILFLGFRDDAKQMISACDLVVLPSYREGVPRALLEAMLSEKPVVATDVRGNRQAVDNYRTGMLVDLRDLSSFSRVLIDLLNDGTMMDKMGKAGKMKVLMEFDEKKVIARILREYKSVIGEHALLLNT